MNLKAEGGKGREARRAACVSADKMMTANVRVCCVGVCVCVCVLQKRRTCGCACVCVCVWCVNRRHQQTNNY